MRRAVPLTLIPLALALSAVAVIQHQEPTNVRAASATVLAQHVYNTGPDGLWLHPAEPRIASATSGTPMPDGTEFDVTCFAEGDEVNGDAVWLKGTDTRTGAVGFAADYYIDTDVHRGQEAAELQALGLPDCDSGTPQVTDDGQSSDNPGYNGQAAADWALDHARDPQPYGKNDEDCTFFASNALLAGGLEPTDTWKITGRYGFPHIPGTNIGSGAPGTATAWQAPLLVNYLLNTYPDSTFQELDFAQNSQPDAKPGDLIAYDWQGDGTIDHISVVVDDATGTQYPEVAQWGNVRQTGDASLYQKTGWTWSRYYNGWIAKVYPAPQAYLLHVVAPQF